jgi:starch-binding outer membrane protein, SusD/RagB family
MNMYMKQYIIPVIMVLLAATGCKKFVDVPLPIDQIPTTVVFSDDTKASTAVRGLYSAMIGGTGGLFAINQAFSGGISLYAGLSSDELITTSSSLDVQGFASNQVLSNSSINYSNLYGPLYVYIYQANALLAGLDASKGVTAAGKTQLTAETRCLRAMFYFYLVNMYDSVPIVTGTDYNVNALVHRSSADDVYKLITDDLTYAQANLSSGYTTPGQRIRVNRWTAAAMLARVYLYRKQWQDAETQASAVLGSGYYSLEQSFASVFLNNSHEAIFQLIPLGTNLYTNDGYNYISTGIFTYQLSPTLMNAFSPGDLRRTNWVKTNVVSGTSYYGAYKYKLNAGTGTTKTEYATVMRLAEQYLIRAEARANNGNLTDAIADVDSIRHRAGLPLIANINPGISQASLLDTIAHERQVEMFTEWGDRWFDVKRRGQADAVFGVDKTGWTSVAALLPIPLKEIQLNPNMTQNKGYN